MRGRSTCTREESDGACGACGGGGDSGGGVAGAAVMVEGVEGAAIMVWLVLATRPVCVVQGRE